MAKRKRNDAPPVRSPDPERLSQPARGSIFTVARARQELAQSLPRTVYQPPEKKPLNLIADDQPGQRDARPKAARRVVQADATRDDHRAGKLRRPQACKVRPARSSGKGGSRPFVPWCSR